MKQHTEPNAHGPRASRGAKPSGARKLMMPALAALLVTGFLVGPAEAQVARETEHVVGQGPSGPVVSMNGATLWRSDKGLTVNLRMPTPVSGSYIYPGPSPFQPEGAFAGHPEAFSLWLFAFNAPEECLSDPCDIADFVAGRGMSGAFNAGGHVVGGPNLQLSGRVTVNDTPFMGFPLLEPRTAEVHLAVAPHGALQPDVMPNQIQTPIGTPAHWWLAFFLVD